MRAAWWAAAGLLVAVVAVAAVVVPWEAAVGPWPWADLDHPAALATFPPADVAEIASYTERAWPVTTAALLLPAILAILVAITPIGRRLVDATGGRVLASAALILLGLQVAVLPLDLRLAALRREAGLQVESWGAWAARWTISTVVLVAAGALATWIVLAILRRWRHWGWLPLAAGAGLVVAALSLAAPVLHAVDGTRDDAALEERLTALADRAGVSVSDVVVVEVSGRSTVANAVVSGWGPTRTIAVYDTVVGADEGIVDALVAHELVHVRHGDVVVGTTLGALGAAALMAILAGTLSRPWVQARAGARGPGDARLVPTALAVVVVGLALATPAAATVSRPMEARADREAVALTGDPEAYADLLRLLAVTNRSTLEPPAWRYSLVFTHPTPLQRLADLDQIG